MNHYVRCLYNKEIDVHEYLKNITKIKDAMSPGIRYLYIMLLTFEDLKLTEEPAKIGRILMKSITDNLETIKNKEGDRQFIYYILKIGDLMQYRGDRRVSMMGKVHTKFPVMEKYRFRLRHKVITKGDFLGVETPEALGKDDVVSLSDVSQSQMSRMSDKNP